MIDEKSLTDLDPSAFLEATRTTTAGRLYARSLFEDTLRSISGMRAGKHNKARALRAKAKIAKRKAKRKA